ncbi:hypothetical protein BGX29_007218 [Mortierella sp. GBA35]|nr:hypothetical protein BGX29_007218 [Mortierella sp. GBA35]
MTITRTPRWTWSSYDPTSRPAATAHPGPVPGPGNNIPDGGGSGTAEAPILAITGPLNALAFIICLMVIPAFIVWVCMRRSRNRAP